MPLRYLFDEHLRGTLPEAVSRRAWRLGYSVDVVQVGDAADLPLGTQDPEMLRWAEAESRVIVSLDSRTLPGHLASHLAAGRHSPGVFIARRPLNVALAEWLVLLAFATEPGDWADRVTFVP
jgi:hypothetical protein